MKLTEEDILASKRKSGFVIPQKAKRKKIVQVCMKDEEYEFLNKMRSIVRLSSSEFLRLAMRMQTFSVVPEINQRRWVELSRVASNLNQLNRNTPKDTLRDIEECTEILKQLRRALLGAFLE